MTQNTDTQKAWAMMKRIGVCMLVTHERTGDSLHARPMVPHVDLENDAIWFLSDRRREKSEEIAKNLNVCLAFADTAGQKYVSLSGHAKVLNDRAKISQLWSTPAKAWWPSKDDPNIQILHVTPIAAEFWDGPGAIVAYANMATAALTGTQSALGSHQKVAL